MQNDLIVIEFDDAPAVETLLDPRTVPQCADSLKLILEGLVRLSDSVPSNVSISLAAVAQGSIKIGYRVKIDGNRIINKDRIGMTADTLTIIQIAIQGLMSVLLAADVVVPANPTIADMKQSALVMEISNSALRDAAVMGGVEHLVNTLEKTGIRRISITVPDAPTCDFVPNRGSDAGLIGIKAKNKITSSAPFYGTLTLTGKSVKVHSTEQPERVVYLGRIVIDDQTRNVIVEWHSRKPVPIGTGFQNNGVNLTVRGSVMPYAYDTPQAPTPQITPIDGEVITYELKEIDGVLIVEKQVVEE